MILTRLAARPRKPDKKMFDLATNPDSAVRTQMVGILLAAGHGRRYADAAAGQDKLVAALPDGTPVVVAAAASLQAATARVVAVTRADNERVARLLAEAGCEVVTTGPDADGMGDSLAIAARHALRTCAPGIASCLVALGDMPWIRPETCLRIARQALDHPVVVPAWNGLRGHPVAFHRSIWPSLAALTGDVGARGVLARHGATELAVDDPGIRADVDTPGDLAGARHDGPGASR